MASSVHSSVWRKEALTSFNPGWGRRQHDRKEGVCQGCQLERLEQPTDSQDPDWLHRHEVEPDPTPIRHTLDAIAGRQGGLIGLRSRDLGIAGREALRRTHSLQALRSRASGRGPTVHDCFPVNGWIVQITPDRVPALFPSQSCQCWRGAPPSAFTETSVGWSVGQMNRGSSAAELLKSECGVWLLAGTPTETFLLLRTFPVCFSKRANETVVFRDTGIEKHSTAGP
jgi:hypothetical protein